MDSLSLHLVQKTPVTSPPAITLTPNPELAGGYGTGFSVGELNGDGLADLTVGAPNAGSAACPVGGVAYIYVSRGGTPLSQQFILAAPTMPGQPGQNFAQRVVVAPAPRVFLVTELRKDVNGDGTIDASVKVSSMRFSFLTKEVTYLYRNPTI